MRIIKSTGPDQSHGTYGADHGVRVSKATALALAGMYPLPRVGYEITIAIKPALYGFKDILYLANKGGGYVVQSSSTAIADWPEVFGVTVKRPAKEMNK